MRTDLDPIGAVYEERNCLALAFARMARAAGWVVGWVDDDDAGRDWPVLMIDTPAGQVSWHLPRLWPLPRRLGWPLDSGEVPAPRASGSVGLMPMLSFRISDELAARVDEAAGGNRSAWIKRAIEEALAGPVQERSGSGPAAGSRAMVDRRTELLRRARI
jgi:hypothetical protein